jgi:MOSC domain-containing protein YiiM
MSAITVVSVRLGRVREHPRPAWDHGAGATWRSAYVKDEVDGPVPVTTLGLAGDEHGDPSVHGGPHQAVLAYAAAHYPRWREEPGLERMGPGAFAENLTLEGTAEDEACIGDVYEAGELALEVSQPRGPCANIARFWDRPDLVRRVTETARAGWYLRVLRQGAIAHGAVLRLAARPHPGWTVARVFRLRVTEGADAAGLRAAAALAALSPGWRERFRVRADAPT